MPGAQPCGLGWLCARCGLAHLKAPERRIKGAGQARSRISWAVPGSPRSLPASPQRSPSLPGASKMVRGLGGSLPPHGRRPARAGRCAACPVAAAAPAGPADRSTDPELARPGPQAAMRAHHASRPRPELPKPHCPPRRPLRSRSRRRRRRLPPPTPARARRRCGGGGGGGGGAAAACCVALCTACCCPRRANGFSSWCLGRCRAHRPTAVACADCDADGAFCHPPPAALRRNGPRAS